MDQLTPERWRRIRSGFERALDVQATARPAVLENLCGEDLLLRGEIDTLLSADSRANRLLETPVSEFAGPLIGEIARELPDAPPMTGRRVGPTIWFVRSPVAAWAPSTWRTATTVSSSSTSRSKLLRRDLDTEDLLRRFLAERQILASLNHPNIARLLDGGETEDGRPYLVMEHVEGQPIDAYCDAHRSSVEDRLELSATGTREA